LQQPDGGPKDTEPPKVLEESPKNLTRNFKGNKVEITFDEYFKLNSEFTEISISPAQETPPTFKTKQKTLEIAFKDSLEENTTYTVNFGKAIQDVNESNILKNYSFVFSTGPTLDSLQISGKVISSDDNKPMLDATVFIFPLKRDTLFGKKKPSLYTTTDSSGNFSIKNLRAGEYTIYALKEQGVDRIYNSNNEEIAFLADPIQLTKDSTGIILKLFKEIPSQFRIIDRKIENDGRITIIANKPINNPSVSFINSDAGKDAIIDYSLKGDSTYIWLKELTFDSLLVSINEDNKPLDTLTFKRAKKDTYIKNILFTNNLSGGKIKPGVPLVLTFNIPIGSINLSKVTLLEDSVAKKPLSINKLPNNNRKYQVNYPWIVKKKYSLAFLDNAVTDFNNAPNKALKLDFELDELENYGNLILKVEKLDSTKNYIVQLVTDKNILYKETIVKDNMTINYPNIPTGKFMIKVIEDENKNGLFDTGNVKLKKQPEKSWFYDKEIITRANWDREEILKIPVVF
jgi:uncharacterized protein (DUF2141 family)